MQRFILSAILFVIVSICGIFVIRPPTNVSASKQLISPVLISVVDGKLASGPRWVQVYEGDTVALSFVFNSSGTVFLHGYEKRVSFEKDKPVRLVFKAAIAGRFMYEIEQTHTQIGMLEVLPSY